MRTQPFLMRVALLRPMFNIKTHKDVKSRKNSIIVFFDVSSVKHCFQTSLWTILTKIRVTLLQSLKVGAGLPVTRRI